MKTVKVSIQDENTLVLQEDANKGDLIDLKSLHDLEIDRTTINAVVKSIRQDKFAEVLKEKTDQIKRDIDHDWEIKVKDIVSEKDQINAKLEEQIRSNSQAQELAIVKAISPIQKERDKLVYELKSKDTEKESELLRLNEKFQYELKTKDEMIAYYKDMKAKQSTKMLGETLEQHCEISFNKIRAAAFPRATFSKDNDARSGSKGDYIYREMDDEGNEIISIMFEMKNEGDETATKKKNEDFLKELDKDRTEKKCEYGILVSLLESDNELYNDGIVDVSHYYHKMYVIRPQFFIPTISFLRNAALNSLQYKAELALVRSQNIDITNFESRLGDFQTSFSRSYGLAHDRFSDAIDGIDKSIAHLQKIKENLLKADDHYRIASGKAEDLSIKKLTKDNPTMAAKFEELKDTQ